MTRSTTRRLRLLGRAWRVVFRLGVVRDSDGNECFGTCDADRLVIEIDARVSPEQVRSKLAHEVAHAIIDATNGQHPADEETCVRAQEAGWYYALRENPWLARFLLAGSPSEKGLRARPTSRKKPAVPR